MVRNKYELSEIIGLGPMLVDLKEEFKSNGLYNCDSSVKIILGISGSLKCD